MSRFTIALSLLLLPLSAAAGEPPSVKGKLAIYADDKEGPLRRPEGVACGPGTLVVADTANGRLLRYDLQEGGFTPSAEIKLPQLGQPIRLQLGPKGEILSLDGKSRRIARLGPGGEFVGYVEPQGLPGDEKVVARSFKVDGKGNLYVLDLLGGRVLVLDAADRVVKQIPFEARGRSFSDLAVNGRGQVLLLDSANATVLTNEKDENAFAPLTGRLDAFVSFPTALEVDGRDDLYLSDQTGGRIVSLRPDGSLLGQLSSMGWKPGLLNHPSQLCLLPGTSDVAVADRNNNRVQLFLGGR